MCVDTAGWRACEVAAGGVCVDTAKAGDDTAGGGRKGVDWRAAV